MLLRFYVHCGFGIGFLLDNTRLSWELHGPHTALYPEHVLASVPTCLDTKCGKRVVPTVTTGHPLDQYCPTDGPARKPSACYEEWLRISLKCMRIHLDFLLILGQRLKSVCFKRGISLKIYCDLIRLSRFPLSNDHLSRSR